MMPSLARLFILIGLLFLLIGGLIYLANRLSLPLGRLPGDIHIERENVRFYFPLATSILISLLLTLVLSVLGRLFKR